MRTVFSALFILIAAPAFAGPASEAVRFFYTSIGAEFDPQNRDRFVDPARALLEANDTGDDRCVDFGIAVDGQDYDEAEILRTLDLRESVQGDGAIVMAHFTLFGEKRSIEWTLEREGRAWKVADVMSLQGGWRLSDFEC